METTWTTLEGSSLVLKVVERVQEKKEFKLRQQIRLDEHILSPPITHDCDYWEGKCEDLFANASTRKWLMAGTLRLPGFDLLFTLRKHGQQHWHRGIQINVNTES